MSNAPHLTGFSGLQVSSNQASSLPSGGLLEATNVACYRPGILESRPGLFPVTSYSPSTGTALETAAVAAPVNGNLYYGELHGNQKLGWSNSADTQPVTATSTNVLLNATSNEVCNLGRYTQNKAIIPSQYGPLVVPETEGPTDNKHARRAGIPRALGPVPYMDSSRQHWATFVSSTAAAEFPFGSNCVARYRWVLAIHTSDGRILRGPPTLASWPALSPTNAGHSYKALFGLLIPREFAQLAADGFSCFVETYRTLAVPAAQAVVPEYFLIFSTPVPADVASNNYYVGINTFIRAPLLTDDILNSALGEELYTDDAVEGPLQENDRPPGCTILEQYNGFVIYANTTSRTTATDTAYTQPGVGAAAQSMIVNGVTYLPANAIAPTYATHTPAWQPFELGNPFPQTENDYLQVYTAINDCIVNDPAGGAGYATGYLHGAVPTAYVQTVGGVDYAVTSVSFIFGLETAGTINVTTTVTNFGPSHSVIPTLGQNIPGQLAISKDGFVDAVPPLNVLAVGDPTQPINALQWLRGGLMCFKPDGVFYVSGSFINDTGNDFSVNVVDRSYHLSVLASFTQLENAGFGAVDEGLIKFTEGAVQLMDAPVFADKELTYLTSFKQVMCHPNRRELYYFPYPSSFNVRSGGDPASVLANGFLVFGLQSQAFTVWTFGGSYNPSYTLSGGLSRAYNTSSGGITFGTDTVFAFRPGALLPVLQPSFPPPAVVAFFDDIVDSASQFYETGLCADFAMSTVISSVASTATGLTVVVPNHNPTPPYPNIPVGATLIVGPSGTQGVGFVSSVVDSSTTSTLTLINVDNPSAFVVAATPAVYVPQPMSLQIAAMGADNAANEKVFDEVVWGTRNSNIVAPIFTVLASNTPASDPPWTFVGSGLTPTGQLQRQPIYRFTLPRDFREANEVYVGLRLGGDARDSIALESVEVTVTGQGVRGQQ